MKIKQVEELVGITRKNIRFYEDQGLLNVERAENGYREYHTADIARLQEIKLFRKMDISIEEMKLLFEKKKSLQICLEQHLKELEADGLIVRKVYPQIPPKVEYSLTDRGHSLMEVLDKLCDWGNENRLP